MTAAEVPADLAAIAAGPELAAALHALALPGVANDRLLEVLAAQYRQLCHEQARLMAVLVEVGHSSVPAGPGEAVRTDGPGRYAPAETRAALRWSRHAADVEHDLAETVVLGMPLLFEAWLAGVVDRPRVRVFDQYLTGLTPEQIARICRIAVPRAPKLTTGQLAHLLRRMVIAADPDAAARWYRRGVRDRNVTAYPAPDGTITVAANGLPADEAEAACERIQQLAAAAKRAGHPGRIGQIRCDLFLGLLDGRFHGMTTEQVVNALIADYRPSGPAGPAGPGRAAAAGDGRSAGPGSDAGERDDGGPGDSGPGDSRPDDIRSGAGRPGDSRPGDSRPGDSGPGDDGSGDDGSGDIRRGAGGPGEGEADSVPAAARMPAAATMTPPAPVSAPTSGSASRSGSGWPPCSGSTTIPPRSPASGCSSRPTPGSAWPGRAAPRGASPSPTPQGLSCPRAGSTADPPA